jgi:hypothetical protein
MLALTLAVCVPTAWQLRLQTDAADRERLEIQGRFRGERTALEHLDATRVAGMRLRRAADRYAADVQARPIVPWTTVVGELSRRRPAGLKAVRLGGDGARFRVQFPAEQAPLAMSYAQNMRQSPYVEFVDDHLAQQGADSAGQVQVVGRLMGE